MEQEPKPLSPIEIAKLQEQSALENHETLVKALENNSNDSELRVNIDKAYDAWQEAKHKVAQLEEGK